MFDFLFEFTEYSEYEGEQILVECETIEKAWDILLNDCNWEPDELCFIKRMSVEEGEMLGLDTY